MKLFSIFKRKPQKEEPYAYADILHIWEDDILMRELLPKENLTFIMKETRRVEGFGQEHFDGSGFSDITIIGEKPFKTFDKHISVNEVKLLMQKTKLQKVEKVVMQFDGLLEKDRVPLAYGLGNFAIVFEVEEEVIHDIWINGRTKNTREAKSLVEALQLICGKYELMAADWFRKAHSEMGSEEEITSFVSSSC